MTFLELAGVQPISSLIPPPAFRRTLAESNREQTCTRGSAMNFPSESEHLSTVTQSDESDLTISRWVNEPYPPLNQLLSDHDVARLTRRPRWILTGLSVLGRFPKKFKFRGRGIGWRQVEVFEWMARERMKSERGSACDSGPRPQPMQRCLPLRCAPLTIQPRRWHARGHATSCRGGTVVRGEEPRR